MTDREALKKIGFWCNRANDAYAMGEAEWLKEDGYGDVLTHAAARMHAETGSWHQAAVLVEAIAVARGIVPARHRWRPRA